MDRTLLLALYLMSLWLVTNTGISAYSASKYKQPFLQCFFSVRPDCQ